MSAQEAPVVPQNLVALARANSVRLGIADLKREMAAGEVSLREALLDDRADSLTVFALLCAQRRWGRARALPVLSEARVSEMRRVASLTVRQRLLIAEIVEAGARATR